MKYIKIILLILSCCNVGMLYAQNDTIVLKNNHVLVGTIKSMNNGVLTVKTSYSKENFKIKWLQVENVHSKRDFLVNLTDGTRFNGAIMILDEYPGKVVLVDKHMNFPVNTEDIVYLKQVESDVISRIDAELSVGFNFSRVNNLTQLSVISALSYTGSKWYFNTSYNHVSSSQDEVTTTTRIDASIGSRYFLKNDWFALLSSNFLVSSEQQLKLRTATSSGVGKFIVHTNKMYLGAGAGLAWNNERYESTNIASRNSLEAFGALEVNLFDFNDLSLNSNVVAYPSLTEQKRFRMDFSFSFKYDLPLNLFVRTGVNYNFDNKPVENAIKSDYVFQVTFGWEK